jgi:AraC-like DNA-binding protein
MKFTNINNAEISDVNEELSVTESEGLGKLFNIRLPYGRYSIILIIKGKGVLLSDFIEYQFAENSIIITDEKGTDMIKFASGIKPVFIVLSFSGHILTCPEAHIRLKDLPVLKTAGQKKVFQPEEIVLKSVTSCFNKIKIEILHKERWQWNMIRIHLTEILILLSRIVSGAGKNTEVEDDDTFNRFENLVEEFFIEHKPIDFYAGMLNLTSHSLARKIKNATDGTFQSFINERVITESMRKLFNTGNSVKEIAYEMGFEDPAYFHRFFKKATGYTPQDFRAYALKKYS